MVGVMYRFIWSVSVSEPNTTRKDVGLASFSVVQHMSAYNSGHYTEGKKTAIDLTRQ